jgi:hypothetical protein
MSSSYLQNLSAPEEMQSSNGALVNFALRGLQRCWMPELGRWSHIYHLDGRNQPNQSLPHSDVFYTLNVLVGLSRVPQHSIDVKEVFERNAAKLTVLPVRKYAFGTALWAGAELGLELPAEVSASVQSLLASPENWKSFLAQDLGMLLIGAVAQARRDPKKWSPIAANLFSFLLQGYHSPSSLFFNSIHEPRRRFSSFATQTYLTLASYCYGDFAGDKKAISIANSATEKLIELQGPNGEWPWFFDSNSGRVLDYYEVYSVHQYGMAPAFLEWAERLGAAGAREALIKGFRWVLGENQLSVPMIIPELSLSIRSQVRKGELDTKRWRVLRAVRNAALGLNGELVAPENIVLRRECRSYELGWILWSFGSRTDLPQLTEYPLFSERGQPGRPALSENAA